MYQPPQPPSQPGFYPYQQPSAPVQPPPRGQKKPPKWAMGCGYAVVIVAVLSLCVCGANVATSLAHSSTPTPTTTSVAASNPTTLAVVATATLTTKKVSATPTHSKPKPTATSAPAPKPTSAPQTTGINGNPWGYTLDSTNGSLIYSPPASFCSYFACIASFWNGHGYVDQCSDGDYSKSGGIKGACSHHGGEAQPLYSH